MKPDKTGCLSCGSLSSVCTACDIKSDNSAPDICTQCSSGYVIPGNKKSCTKCPSGCKNDACSDSGSSGTATCNECVSGYGVKPDKSGCVSCGPNCVECTIDAAGAATCTKCSSYYEIAQMKTCDCK